MTLQRFWVIGVLGFGTFWTKAVQDSEQFLLSVLFFVICVVPLSAMAGDTDKAKQVTCAAIKVFECTSANGYREVTAESIFGACIPR